MITECEVGISPHPIPPSIPEKCIRLLYSCSSETIYDCDENKTTEATLKRACEYLTHLFLCCLVSQNFSVNINSIFAFQTKMKWLFSVSNRRLPKWIIQFVKVLFEYSTRKAEHDSRNCSFFKLVFQSQYMPSDFVRRVCFLVTVLDFSTCENICMFHGPHKGKNSNTWYEKNYITFYLFLSLLSKIHAQLNSNLHIVSRQYFIRKQYVFG
jgi:hypothetical protein